jgi:putative inorganic carbon (hco3(-)) transporter
VRQAGDVLMDTRAIMKLGNRSGGAADACTPLQAGTHAGRLIDHVQVYGLCAITFTSFFPRLFHYQEYAFLLLLAVALVFAWTAKINPYVRTPLDLPLLAFLGWVLLTIPFSVDPAYSFSEWRKFLTQTLVLYWAMFVLRVHGGPTAAGKVVLAVVVGSCVLSVFALDDFVIRGGTWRDRQIRASAPSSDYNWLSTYFVLAIPLLVGWLFTERHVGLRVLGVASLLSGALAQIAAYTRAAWVAHLAQALSFVFIVRRQRWAMWVSVGVLASAALFAAISSMGYQRETLDPWTFQARLKTWGLGVEQVVQHPLVGTGFGNDTFSKVYTAEVQADADKGAVEKVLPALHNTFAMVLMGSGVPALVVFIWIIVRAVQELLAGVRSHPPWTEPMLLRTAVAFAVIGFIVRNVFDYMFAGSLASLFWILLAVGFSTTNGQSAIQSPKLR